MTWLADAGSVRQAYWARLRSFVRREGLYPLSYTLAPVTIFVLDPPRLARWPSYVEAPLTLVLAAGATLLHLPSYWLDDARLRRLIAAQSAFALLATLLMPAAVFLYLLPLTAAARFVGARDVASVMAGVGAAASVHWYLLFDHIWWLMPAAAIFFGLIARFDVSRERTNARLKLAAAESERFGASAERERIARDLHDLLGQSLSLIAVKAELTKKLADRDLDRALRENDDVIRIAKKTLGQVRQAVTSYRAPTLSEELANARLALHSVGAVLDDDVDTAEVGGDDEAVLAFILREAVTNVVRHARAGWCRVVLETTPASIRFTIRDDGRWRGGGEGSGITGMRARVEASGGALEITHDGGTHVVVTLPRSSPRGSAQVAT